MNQMRCRKILIAEEAVPAVIQILDLCSEDNWNPAKVPSFQEMLASTPEPFPFVKDFEKAQNDPIVVLHSSGSTGKSRLPPDLNVSYTLQAFPSPSP